MSQEEEQRRGGNKDGESDDDIYVIDSNQEEEEEVSHSILAGGGTRDERFKSMQVPGIRFKLLTSCAPKKRNWMKRQDLNSSVCSSGK